MNPTNTTMPPVSTSTISVIGGSGFIGTRLVKRLIYRQSVTENAIPESDHSAVTNGKTESAQSGHINSTAAKFTNEHNKRSVRIVDKSPSHTFPNLVTKADVRSLDELREAIADESIIINLAAEHKDDVRPVSLYDEVNVGGARNLCTVAREKNVKTIIFTSTVAVYGFAPVGTDETGTIAPFNDYGRTKFEAEEVFREWQLERPNDRTLVIIRPTVVFGEGNRGNVYNLFKQIATNKFVMIGNGKNRKSMAYVENVAAFIEHALPFNPGIHVYNYVDKPDLSMNELANSTNRILSQNSTNGSSWKQHIRIPYPLGYVIGKILDLAALATGKQFTISSIRIKKFCADTVFDTSVAQTNFSAPIKLNNALERTVNFEFVKKVASKDCLKKSPNSSNSRRG